MSRRAYKPETYWPVDPRGTRVGSLAGYQRREEAERYATIIWDMAGCDLSKPAVKELFDRTAIEVTKAAKEGLSA